MYSLYVYVSENVTSSSPPAVSSGTESLDPDPSAVKNLSKSRSLE